LKQIAAVSRAAVIARKLLLLGLAIDAVACASPRVAMAPIFRPIEPPLAPPRTDVALTLRHFIITNRGENDTESDVGRLRAAFIRYVLSRSATSAPSQVELDVTILPDIDRNRTFILDALGIYPGLGGLWPFIPEWGNVTISIDVLARWPGHETPEKVHVGVAAPYSSIFYSWYRTDQAEAAYQRAYDVAFSQLADRLRTALDRWIPQPAAQQEVADEANPETATASVAALPELETPYAVFDAVSGGVPLQLTEEDGFRVIATPKRAFESNDSWLHRYLGAMGGLEAGLIRGGASVNSSALLADGTTQTVGSGSAHSEGYTVSFFRPPDRTGFFFPPSIGFLSETITISGFRQSIPVTHLQAGSGVVDIPAVASDPKTGLPVDIDTPISYLLRLNSGFVGQGIGLNLVLGGDVIQFFTTAVAALNVFELRHADVTIDTSRVAGFSTAFFRSGSFAGQVGFTIPDLHLAVRLSGEYDWYAQFDYPKPVEFQGPVGYNPEKDVFERQRVFVTGASLSTTNWTLSAVALF
jgi:hypothetical protein